MNLESVELTFYVARINLTTSVSYIYGCEVLLGIGGGAFVQAGYAVTQAVVDPVDVVYAISFIMIGKRIFRFFALINPSC